MDISLIIPAYNEKARIGSTLAEVHDYFSATGLGFEIIVVDDGSKDDTALIAGEFAEKHSEVKVLSHKQNTGKGSAVRSGVLAARGELLLFSDADLSTPIQEFEKMKKVAEEGYDIVIGSRGLPESDVRIKQGVIRRVIGIFGSMIIKLLVISRFSDTQCGFKMFKKDAGKKLFLHQRVPGFAFDVEVLYRAVRRDYRIKEVPVVWINSAGSSVDSFRDPFRVLRDLVRIRTGL